MSDAVSLRDTLSLERIEVNLFRGLAKDQGPRIFGGLVIGQALMAAYHTVEGRPCHSLHCYFIRPGDPAVPILYEVDRSRDGRSFTTRRVTAIQHGTQIFNLAASFQEAEDGFSHQDPMPRAPAHAELPSEIDAWGAGRPIEMRWTEPRDWNAEPAAGPPAQSVWMRAIAPLGDDVALQQAALAYASDMSLMSTGMRPHAVTWRTPGFQSASLDHAIWFHQPSDFNAWHLYDQISPSASGGRGLNFGRLYREDGALVATTAQEGLMRLRRA